MVEPVGGPVQGGAGAAVSFVAVFARGPWLTQARYVLRISAAPGLGRVGTSTRSSAGRRNPDLSDGGQRYRGYSGNGPE